MKKSPMPPRKTPLTSSVPLRPSVGLSRSPIARKAPRTTSEEARGRAAVAARSSGRCEVDPRHPAEDWSHRVARGRCGSWQPSNGVAMCRFHHAIAHDYPRFARALGWHVRTGQDPAVVPIWLAAGWQLLDDEGGVTPTDRPVAA